MEFRRFNPKLYGDPDDQDQHGPVRAAVQARSGWPRRDGEVLEVMGMVGLLRQCSDPRADDFPGGFHLASLSTLAHTGHEIRPKTSTVRHSSPGISAPG